MKRFVFVLLLLLALSIACSVIVTAHPGRTDSNGGHWNSSTGEYHYHGTSDGSGNSNPTGNTTNQHWDDPIDASDVFMWITIVGSLLLFFGPPIYSFLAEHIKVFLNKRKSSPNQQTKGLNSQTSKEVDKEQTSQPTTPPEIHKTASLTTPSPTVDEPPVSIPHPKIRGSEEYFSPPTSSTIKPKPSSPTPHTLPNHHQQPSAPRKPLKDYPEILDYNADFLTERQVIAYAESISTSRGKRAVTEFYHYDDLTVHDEKKPYRVESGIFSANSLHYYETTLTSCTCPDHQSRHIPCKHMIALAIKASALTVDQEAIKKKK